MRKKILVQIAQIILMLAFLFFGITKFTTSPEEGAGIFGSIGGVTAQYLTGAYEIIAGILVIIPATAFWGAIMIAVSMSIAIILHLTILGIEGFFMTLFILAIVFLLIAIYIIIQKKKTNRKWN